MVKLIFSLSKLYDLYHLKLTSFMVKQINEKEFQLRETFPFILIKIR